MSANENFGEMIEESAHLLDEIEAVVKQSNNEWCVLLEGEGLIKVVVNPELSMVTFLSSIGKIPEQKQGEVYEMFLRTNNLWPNNGGTYFSLHESDEILQIQHFFLEMDIPALVGTIQDHWNKWKAWKEALPELEGSTPPAESSSETEDPADGSDSADAGFLRV